VGVLNPLYDAVAWLIMRIHAGVGALFGPSSGWSWALTIVILVVLMRLLLLPLFIKQMHAMREMGKLAPQMTALRKQYKNDKQRMNQEVMKLYQENGVNPLSGCLPIVAQFPVFIALFNVLRAISGWKQGQHPQYGLTVAVVQSAHNAHIFGATVADKFLFQHPAAPLHARAVILVAVLISVTTTFLTVRQSMKRGLTAGGTPQMPDNPMAQSQKYMAYIVPFFALSGLYWQFGLVLYWVMTNLWTLGQQHVLFKRFPQPLAAEAGGAVTSGGSASGSQRQASPKAPQQRQGKAQQAAGTAKTTPSSKAAQSAKTAQSSGKTPQKPAPASPPAVDTPPPLANGGKNRVLRRLSRNKPEPEPEPPVEPPAKLVRQQPVRQSRSRRSGKR
jgi:YidC/Oxa1 family membrane protein insertase